MFGLLTAVFALVVPHHNLVKNLRLDYLTQIVRQNPNVETIIIIGPDHFSPYQKSTSYGNLNWQLVNSQIDFAKGLETKLSPYLNLNNGIVRNDHTIYNLLPDIKSVWPNAQIFPILIGQKYSFSKLDPLISQVAKICQKNCLLLASVDFSHYLPATLANVHDRFTLKALNNLDPKLIQQAEVDSPQSLYFLINYALQKNIKKWHLFAHTNSGILANNFDAETTTHIFGSYSFSLLPNLFPDRSTTFMSSPPISQSDNLTSLGERFFYGTELKKSPIPPPFSIPPNFVTAGTIDKSKVTLIFLPIFTKNNQTFFQIGQAKKDSLKSLLSPHLSNPKFKIDLNTGTLTYVQ
ncbi:MAG: AmmeMemoRadiSam system protein B [Candidatus Shapirobacteria bacterium]|jgi:AmmeMemoRadiSam system protein B